MNEMHKLLQRYYDIGHNIKIKTEQISTLKSDIEKLNKELKELDLVISISREV